MPSAAPPSPVDDTSEPIDHLTGVGVEHFDVEPGAVGHPLGFDDDRDGPGVSHQASAQRIVVIVSDRPPDANGPRGVDVVDLERDPRRAVGPGQGPSFDDRRDMACVTEVEGLDDGQRDALRAGPAPAVSDLNAEPRADGHVGRYGPRQLDDACPIMRGLERRHLQIVGWRHMHDALGDE